MDLVPFIYNSKVVRVIIIYIPLLFISQFTFAGHHSEPEKKKNDEVTTGFANKDIFRKIDDIKHILYREINQNNNDAVFDSLASVAIALTESTFSFEKTMEVYQTYFDLVQMEGQYVNYKNLVNRTEQLILENNYSFEKSELWLSISESASRLNFPMIAHKFALKVFSESELDKNPEKKVHAYLTLGKSLEIQKYYIEAYQNYLNASYLAETLEQSKKKNESKKNCYHHLFEFHRNVNDYDQAAKFKMLEIELIQTGTKNDSLALYWAKYDMCGLAILSNKFGNILSTLDDLLKFAEKAKNKKLKDYSFSLYRNYLIQTNELKGFQRIYVEKYPEELERLKKMHPVLYHQIKSKLAEHKKDIIVAKEEYKKALDLVGENTNSAFKSNFYNRYGLFLLKYGNVNDAKHSFLLAYEEAVKSQYMDYLIESSYYLDSLFALTGNYFEAHKFSNINKQFLVRRSELNKQDEFLRMELANESRQVALNQKKQEQELSRKFNLQYAIITLSILFFFLIFIVFSRLKVPLWAIKGLGFVSVLMLFEFIILILDQELHHMTHGAPLWIFAIKVTILLFLFPLHHLIEKAIIKFMIQKKQIWIPKKSHFTGIMHKLWPWMSDQEH